MGIIVRCPNCKAGLMMPDESSGRTVRVRCRACTNVFPVVVPAAAPARATVPPAPKAVRPSPQAPPAARPAPTPQRRPPAPPPPSPPAAAPQPAPAAPPPPKRRWDVLFGVSFVLLAGLAVVGYFLFFRGTQPATPNGNRYAGVEVGSSGIKAVVLDVSRSGDSYEFNVVWDSAVDVSLGKVEKGAKEFDAKALQNASHVVEDLVKVIRTKYEVPQERISLVCSSGVLSPFERDRALFEANRDRLSEAFHKTTDLRIEFVDSQQEVKLDLLGLGGAKEWQDLMLIDVGSGNTKGCYFEQEGVCLYLDIPYGTKSFTKEWRDAAKANGTSLAQQLAKTSKGLLADPLRAQVDHAPGFKHKKNCCLIGGAVWTLANYTHPADRGERLQLSADDFERFAAMAARPHAVNRAEILDAVADPKVREEVEKDIDKIQTKVFTDPEMLQGGAEILQMLNRELNLHDKKLYFFRPLSPWLRGYVLNKSGAAK
jgi:predicted Zn finger-like uncharacterized protein